MAGKLQVDSDGFRKRVAWRGPFGVLSELISNALDEEITRCDVMFAHVSQQSYLIRVEDDSPVGFRINGSHQPASHRPLYAGRSPANDPVSGAIPCNGGSRGVPQRTAAHQKMA